MIRYLVLILLIAFFVVIGRRSVSSTPFDYDEADYISAAERGFVANYSDKGVIRVGTFVEKGLALGFKSEQRTSLSAFIRESGDISFQRHYHGPLYSYWIILARALGARGEYALRWASFLLLAVTAALAALLARELSDAQGGVAPVVAALMTLAGSAGAPTAADITPHAIYVPAALATLYAMVRWTSRPDDRRLAVMGLTLGFALTAIEYAALLVVLSAVLPFTVQAKGLTSAGAHGPWRMLGLVIGSAFATVLVLWPGGLLKLSLVKNYVFFGYFTIVRGGEYGQGSVIDVWAERFVDSPIEYLLILFAVGYWFGRLRRDRRYWPLVCYVAFMLLTTFRNTSRAPAYIGSMLPPLYVLCGVVFERLLRERPITQRRVAVAALAGLIIVSHFRAAPAGAAPEHPGSVRTIISYFQARGGDTGRILVPRAYLPSLQYYYPTLRVGSYSEPADGLARAARYALDSGYAGLLYAGNARQGFGDFIPPSLVARIDTIAAAPRLPFYTLYYHLRRVRQAPRPPRRRGPTRRPY